jgi:hypothetical protein
MTTKRARILELLADGPGLTCEIATELQIRPRVAAANLSTLAKQRKITKTVFDRANGSDRFLWTRTGDIR